ncbi:MAG: transposase [Elusimicrobiota bacterium]
MELFWPTLVTMGMPRQPRIHFPGAIFHVIARGNAGQHILAARKEWEGLRDLLGQVKESLPFELYAYCLMSNHFHLLVRIGDIPLQRIMHRLLTTWALRYNVPRNRIGHVFQGRYKAILCQEDRYFKHLLRYIHLNPVKAGIVHRPEDWPWSGHLDYIGQARRRLIDRAWPISVFSTDSGAGTILYAKFVIDGIKDPAAMREVPPHFETSDDPPPKTPPHPDPLPIEQVAAGFFQEAEIPPELLRGRGRPRWVSRARRDFARRAFLSGCGIRQIAAYLGISASVVSRALNKSQQSQQVNA